MGEHTRGLRTSHIPQESRYPQDEEGSCYERRLWRASQKSLHSVGVFPVALKGVLGSLVPLLDDGVLSLPHDR